MPNFSLPDTVFEQAAQAYPTPFHLYDEGGIRRTARALNQAFAWCPDFKEYFAVKALPNPAILRILRQEGCGVDCSSLTELMLSEVCGFTGHDIMFSSNDTPPEDFRLAKKLGATRTVNLTKEKLPDVMAELGMKEGFDVGLEMSGAAPALNDMIANMKHGGNIALLGIQKPGVGVNWETIIWNGLNIRGIYGRKVWDTWYKMTTMLEAGLDISGIITHRMNIKDYKKGFDAMISGQSGKVILNWEDIDKLEAQSQDC